MSRYISEVDYTQPFGERTSTELPMRFHYFLVILTGVGVLFCLMSVFMLFLTPGMSSSVFSLAQIGGAFLGLLIQGFTFFSLLFKRRWILLIYQIIFWLQVGFGIFSLLILCGFGLVLGNLIVSGAGLVGVGIALLIGGISLGINLFITRCILNYYKRRQHLLK